MDISIHIPHWLIAGVLTLVVFGVVSGFFGVPGVSDRGEGAERFLFPVIAAAVVGAGAWSIWHLSGYPRAAHWIAVVAAMLFFLCAFPPARRRTQ